MKGLVIKDLMCMRKQLKVFGYILFSVLVISVMFVLSCKFGNLAMANAEMIATNQMSDIDVNHLSTFCLMLFMLLPLAVTSDFTVIFVEDGKAGFSKVSASLPISIEKRVLAKFMTVMVLFAVGVLIDILLSFVLSLISDIVIFADFVGIIVSMASIMSIYGALTIVFCFLLKQGNEMHASIAAIFCMMVMAIVSNMPKIVDSLKNMAMEAQEDALSEFNFIEIFKTKSYVFLFLAIFFLIGSYFLSVAIAKRKRGVV